MAPGIAAASTSALLSNVNQSPTHNVKGKINNYNRKDRILIEKDKSKIFHT
jgi:hypothetical protein